MFKEILYTTAIDENGKITHIDDARKGSSYYCPICKNEFILRKSGKSGKGSKRPHFAHNQLTRNCTPEGVMHYSFKRLLINILVKHQTEDKALVVNWCCSICNSIYSGNLLEKVTSIKEEYALKECKPDIALLDEKGSVVAVIEIVVTHKPEEDVLQYYKENQIILIQIDLSSEEDLKMIEEKVANPNVVEFCLNSKCTNYGNNKIKRKLIIGVKRCSGCLGLLKASIIETSYVFGIQRSTDFNEDEIRMAESKGVRFEMRNNKTTNQKYPAIICLNCKRMRSRYRSPRL